jgi:hypothetical protein
MRIFILSISFFFSVIASAQNSLDELLRLYNTESIPYISVSTLNTIQDTVLVLDARERKEYQISHLKGAIHVGYDNFKIESIAVLAFDQKTFQSSLKKLDTPMFIICMVVFLNGKIEICLF